MRGVAAVVILSLKLVAGSPLELSMVGQDITGGPLWPAGEGRRGAMHVLPYYKQQRHQTVDNVHALGICQIPNPKLHGHAYYEVVALVQGG